MLKIITDQFGKKGFIVDNTFITDPYYREDLGVEVDPIEYYGLTEDQLTQFEHMKPKPKEYIFWKEVNKHTREELVIKVNSLDEATEIHNEGDADYKEVHCFSEEITDEGTDENKRD